MNNVYNCAKCNKERYPWKRLNESYDVSMTENGRILPNLQARKKVTICGFCYHRMYKPKSPRQEIMEVCYQAARDGLYGYEESTSGDQPSRRHR